MSTTELPLDQSLRAKFPLAAVEGAELIGVSVEDESQSIIEAVNRFLEPPGKKGSFGRPKSDPGIDNWNDRALPVGALWGHTIVRHFAWQWAQLVQQGQDDTKAIAIVNEDRSLAIFLFHYCFDCLENHAYPTILLAFNMLEAEKIPKQPAGGFVNLMNGVRHIFPPG